MTSGTSNARSGKKFDLEERLIGYATLVIEPVDTTKRSAGGRHVGKQLLRSGTSPLASHGEAQSAESKKDGSIEEFVGGYCRGCAPAGFSKA